MRGDEFSVQVQANVFLIQSKNEKIGINGCPQSSDDAPFRVGGETERQEATMPKN